MEPEKGDPSVHVRVQDVCDAFRSVGARSGDTVFYHGSLRSMGTVDGGPKTVIDGALEAVGPEGTVAMPSLWYHGADPPLDPADFDIDTSPSYVGALSEAMRQDPRSVRSNNFSHSVNAIGKRAAEMAADHGGGGLHHTPWGNKAFADVSPWACLYRWNALYCFIGVTMRVCTMKHYIEARLVTESLNQAPAARRAELEAALSAIGKTGIWPFFNSEAMEKRLADLGVMTYGKIGSATLRAVRTQALVDTASRILRAEPEEWLSEPFLKWRQEALNGSREGMG